MTIQIRAKVFQLRSLDKGGIVCAVMKRDSENASSIEPLERFRVKRKLGTMKILEMST